MNEIRFDLILYIYKLKTKIESEIIIEMNKKYIQHY